MSGGYWGYRGPNIAMLLEDIGGDDQVASRWPGVAYFLKNVADLIETAEHDMDWDLSGDKAIEDDSEFDRRTLAGILDTVLKACPDDWFPRGKSATIQAVQGRNGRKGAR